MQVTNDSAYLTWYEPFDYLEDGHEHIINPVADVVIMRNSPRLYYSNYYLECDLCTAFVMMPRNITLIKPDYGK